MTYSIDELKSLVATGRGIAKPNLFRVFLPSIAGPTATELNLLCRTASLPGKQLMTQEKMSGLQRQKVVNGYAVDDISMSFLVLNNYGVRQYFEAWQALAFNNQTYEIAFKTDYERDVSIQQLEHTTGRVIYQIDLEAAFPTTLNQVDLTNDPDGIMELGVQLSYTNWTSTVGGGSYTSQNPTTTPSNALQLSTTPPINGSLYGSKVESIFSSVGDVIDTANQTINLINDVANIFR